MRCMKRLGSLLLLSGSRVRRGVMLLANSTEGRMIRSLSLSASPSSKPQHLKKLTGQGCCEVRKRGAQHGGPELERTVWSLNLSITSRRGWETDLKYSMATPAQNQTGRLDSKPSLGQRHTLSSTLGQPGRKQNAGCFSNPQLWGFPGGNPRPKSSARYFSSLP